MVIDKADVNSQSCGSFFRNPTVSAQALSQVTKATGLSVSEIPCWPAQDHQVKLSAAWLLERAGFERGYGMGPVGISARHTLASLTAAALSHQTSLHFATES